MAPIVAITGGVLLLRHAPSPARVTAAILARLGVAPDEAARVRARHAPRMAHVAAATIAAMGMPLALAATKGLGVWGQAVVFVVYAAAAPLVVAGRFERGAGRAPMAWSRVVRRRSSPSRSPRG